MKSWEMRRNCALTPKQLFKFYLLLVFMSAAVATGFLLAGFWVILIFTCLELCAVSFGFLFYSKHALDSETIIIDGNSLIVKKFIGHQLSVFEFNTQWVQITPPAQNAKTFEIAQSSKSVHLGQFLRRPQQLQLISALSNYLG